MSNASTRDHSFEMFCTCGPCRRENFLRVYNRTSIIWADALARYALEDDQAWETARRSVEPNESRVRALAAFDREETLRPAAVTK